MYVDLEILFAIVFSTKMKKFSQRRATIANRILHIAKDRDERRSG